MARIFCAWEFGSGLGHLTRLLPIARRLHDAGHEIVLAVPHPAAAKPILDKNFPEDEGLFRLRVVAGTQWQIPTNDPELRTRPTHVLADVLHLFHYQEPTLLERQARVWRDLVKAEKPDLIVADFAPTLRLASWDDAPFVMTGNGYTVPPGGRMLPPIKPWQETLLPFSRQHEAEVLRAMNMVRAALEGPPVDFVGDMMNGELSYVCTIPEFDPYQRYRIAPTLVPFNVPDINRYPTVAERGEQAPVFVYLPANHPLLKNVLALVSRLNVPAHVYISGAEPEKVAKQCGRNVSIHTRPISFEDDLWKFRAIIHHAGLATAYAAIKAGTPQLLLPVNLEHVITSRGAHVMAGAEVIPVRQPPPTAEELEGALRRLLTRPDLHQRIHHAAGEVAKRPKLDSVGEIVKGCLELLEQSGATQAQEEDVDRIAAG